MDKAIETIKSGEATCVLTRGGEIVHTASGRGVKPLINLLDEQPNVLNGSNVSDKIIGKAAATICILGGAAGVYGEIMSDAAVALLEKHAVPYSYGRRVEVIKNRTGDGICPIENSVLNEDDLTVSLANIRATIVELMKG